MTKTYQIVEMTNGGFEIVASRLTFVEACNQAMTLNVNVEGLVDFRELPVTITNREEYYAWQRAAGNNSCPVQADWAYL